MTGQWPPPPPPRRRLNGKMPPRLTPAEAGCRTLADMTPDQIAALEKLYGVPVRRSDTPPSGLGPDARRARQHALALAAARRRAAALTTPAELDPEPDTE